VYIDLSGKDEETDVVVLGTGPGGLAAVGSAVAAGVRVISTEAHNSIGGNGVLSTGWTAFVYSALQREQGIKDSMDLFRKDCEKLVDEISTIYGLIWDRKISKLFAQVSSKMYDILTERGVKFTRLIKRPLQTSVD
jgi:predicted oxidoreductase